MCSPSEKIALTLQLVLYLVLCWIRIEKEASASANPVKNQGFKFGDKAGAKVEYVALFICLERILI
jgi:hypothetical protein